jgi:YHS domain-containing protein
MRLRPLILLILLPVFPNTMAAAGGVNTTWWKSLAIHGYDPVAYFTQGEPVKGKAEFSTEWNDATWRFVSEKHLQLFKASPETYAPAYGGYCAWAMAQGDKADIDPDQWTIIDGRLFLNYNEDIQKKWLMDKQALIEQADQHWQKK